MAFMGHSGSGTQSDIDKLEFAIRHALSKGAKESDPAIQQMRIHLQDLYHQRNVENRASAARSNPKSYGPAKPQPPAPKATSIFPSFSPVSDTTRLLLGDLSPNSGPNSTVLSGSNKSAKATPKVQKELADSWNQITKDYSYPEPVRTQAAAKRDELQQATDSGLLHPDTVAAMQNGKTKGDEGSSKPKTFLDRLLENGSVQVDTPNKQKDFNPFISEETQRFLDDLRKPAPTVSPSAYQPVKKGFQGVVLGGGDPAESDKFVRKIKVAGGTRTVTFDHEPSFDDLRKAQEKYLRLDHPDLYKRYVQLNSSKANLLSITKGMLSKVNDHLLNDDGLLTTAYASGTPISTIGISKEPLKIIERGKLDAAMEIGKQVADLTNRARSILRDGIDAGTAQSDEPNWFENYLSKSDQALGSMTKIVSDTMKPTKQAVAFTNKYVNPAIDVAVNAGRLDWKGVQKTLDNYKNGNTEPGFIASAINPLNWSITDLALDPEAYNKKVEQHLLSGDRWGFVGDVVAPTADVLGMFGAHIPGGRVLGAIDEFVTKGLGKGKNLVTDGIKNFLEHDSIHGTPGADGHPEGWQAVQKQLAKQLERDAKSPDVTEHASKKMQAMSEDMKQGIRDGEPHSATLKKMRDANAKPPAPDKGALKASVIRAQEDLDNAIFKKSKDIKELQTKYSDALDKLKAADKDFAKNPINRGNIEEVMAEARRVKGRALTAKEIEKLQVTTNSYRAAAMRAEAPNAARITKKPNTMQVGDETISSGMSKNDRMLHKVTQKIDGATTFGRSRDLVDFGLNHQQAMLSTGYGKFFKSATAPVGNEIAGLLEEGMNPIVRKIPGLQNAGTETFSSGKALLDSAKEYLNPDTFWDAIHKFKTGYNSLDLQAIENGLKTDVSTSGGLLLRKLQSAQGALRTPVQRAAFQRELSKQIALAEHLGVDVNTPEFLKTAQKEAYEASQRAILRNDNKAYDALKKFSKDIPTLEALYPLARTSTNYAGRIGEYVAGIPYGMFKHLEGTLSGGITAKESAAIARAYKRGGLGLGLMATGYYSSDDALRVDHEGNVFIAGHRIPDGWLHTPAFEVLKMAAIMKQDKGKPTYSPKTNAQDAALEFGMNTPFSELAKTTNDVARKGHTAQDALIDAAIRASVPVDELKSFGIDPRSVYERMKQIQQKK